MKPEFHEGAIGPGLTFAKEFGDGYEIAADRLWRQLFWRASGRRRKILNMMTVGPQALSPVRLSMPGDKAWHVELSPRR